MIVEGLVCPLCGGERIDVYIEEDSQFCVVFDCEPYLDYDYQKYLGCGNQIILWGNKSIEEAIEQYKKY